MVGERMLIENRFDVAVAGVAKTMNQPSHLNAKIALSNTELFAPIELRDNLIREEIAAAGGDPDADRWGNQSDYVYLEIPESLPFDEALFNARLGEFVRTTLPEDRAEIMSYELLPVNQLLTAQFALITGGFNITDILIVAGALVLMIGCLNYSNLVIAQLSLRSQELGVQKILGAKRGLLLVQYSFESVLFVAIGLLLTMLIAAIALVNIQAAGIVGVSPALFLDVGLWVPVLAVAARVVLIAGS